MPKTRYGWGNPAGIFEKNTTLCTTVLRAVPIKRQQKNCDNISSLGGYVLSGVCIIR